MSKGLLFWILWILWLIFGVVMPVWGRFTFAVLAPGLLELILFGLLGWAAFGPPVRD